VHDIAILMEKFRELTLQELRQGIITMDFAMQDSVSHYGECKQEVFNVFLLIKNNIKKYLIK
jgi:hypothetical protein